MVPSDTGSSSRPEPPSPAIQVPQVEHANLWLYSVRPTTAATSASCAKTRWDEGGLRNLEEEARAFARTNRSADVFEVAGRVRFSLSAGCLNGPFLAWRSRPNRSDDASLNRQETEKGLSRRFQGAYKDGRRHGPFRYWDKTGVETSCTYADGAVVR